MNISQIQMLTEHSVEALLKARNEIDAVLSALQESGAPIPSRLTRAITETVDAVGNLSTLNFNATQGTSTEDMILSLGVIRTAATQKVASHS